MHETSEALQIWKLCHRKSAFQSPNAQHIDINISIVYRKVPQNDPKRLKKLKSSIFQLCTFVKHSIDFATSNGVGIQQRQNLVSSRRKDITTPIGELWFFQELRKIGFCDTKMCFQEMSDTCSFLRKCLKVTTKYWKIKIQSVMCVVEIITSEYILDLQIGNFKILSIIKLVMHYGLIFQFMPNHSQFLTVSEGFHKLKKLSRLNM